jgi:hypothetical protein
LAIQEEVVHETVQAINAARARAYPLGPTGCYEVTPSQLDAIRDLIAEPSMDLSAVAHLFIMSITTDVMLLLFQRYGPPLQDVVRDFETGRCDINLLKDSLIDKQATFILDGCDMPPGLMRLSLWLFVLVVSRRLQQAPFPLAVVPLLMSLPLHPRVGSI